MMERVVADQPEGETAHPMRQRGVHRTYEVEAQRARHDQGEAQSGDAAAQPPVEAPAGEDQPGQRHQHRGGEREDERSPLEQEFEGSTEHSLHARPTGAARVNFGCAWGLGGRPPPPPCLARLASWGKCAPVQPPPRRFLDPPQNVKLTCQSTSATVAPCAWGSSPIGRARRPQPPRRPPPESFSSVPRRRPPLATWRSFSTAGPASRRRSKRTQPSLSWLS